MLEIKNLHIKTADKEIVKGLNLSIGENQIHAIMGPNGSGKSTLASTLMGHPGYEVTSGEVSFLAENLLEMEPNERAEKGLFLSFQYPSEVEGVNITSYLRMIYNKSREQKVSPIKFREILKEKMEILDIKEEFVNRYLNDGFSGGEKKRMEMLQMLVLEPKLAILDETDSGLDVDALKVVSKAVNYLVEKNKMSVVVITHYTRILNYIKPQFVHVLKDGKIIKEGGEELAHEIESSGYKSYEN
jgi:Fe-S cluster assembly ATP-binding protein